MFLLLGEESGAALRFAPAWRFGNAEGMNNYYWGKIIQWRFVCCLLQALGGYTHARKTLLIVSMGRSFL
jgi:hypothetical protein